MDPVEKSVTHYKEIQSKEETVEIIFYIRAKRGPSEASLARVDVIKQKGHKGARTSIVCCDPGGGGRPDMN